MPGPETPSQNITSSQFNLFLAMSIMCGVARHLGHAGGTPVWHSCEKDAYQPELLGWHTPFEATYSIKTLSQVYMPATQRQA